MEGFQAIIVFSEKGGRDKALDLYLLNIKHAAEVVNKQNAYN
jgi:hypothetical protein